MNNSVTSRDTYENQLLSWSPWLTTWHCEINCWMLQRKAASWRSSMTGFVRKM